MLEFAWNSTGCRPESKAPAPLPGRRKLLLKATNDALASVLVTGTAIGGGFLALPYTTAPAGFLPSFVLMLFSWLLLLLEAQVASDILVEESGKTSEPKAEG